jgi:hypothetical protein
MFHKHFRWLANWIALAACLHLAGCARDGEQRFMPEPDVARAALAAVLNDWQAGKSLGPISGPPLIQVADTQRRAGQVLLGYEILGELPADNDRRFQVRLTLDQPAAEEKVQYVVVGIDPLWVLRLEDYDMVTHWDHPMPSASSAGDK